MNFFSKKNYLDKEWIHLEKDEERFIAHNCNVKVADWQKKIEKYVPQKLNETLDTAFYKAFSLVFDKGTGVIEKTYNRKKKEQEYQIDAYTSEIKQNAKSLRVFGKKAKDTKRVNMAVSTIEGLGMGVLGMGIPDIPVFISVLLKSIYEIALTYGFTYDTVEEQIFILKIIEVALSHENELVSGNDEMNRFISGSALTISRQDQMKRTADALSKELLYLKFVQGIPIVGVLGGVSDIIYQKKITEYASLKYKRRFLAERKKMKNGICN